MNILKGFLLYKIQSQQASNCISKFKHYYEAGAVSPHQLRDEILPACSNIRL